MRPLDRGVVAGRELQVGVAALLVVVEVLALGIVEVVDLDLELVLGEDPGERVELAQVEEAAGLEQLGDDPGPARQVGKPVERAEAGVDDVEPLAAERRDGVVDVGLDEASRRARSRRRARSPPRPRARRSRARRRRRRRAPTTASRGRSGTAGGRAACRRRRRPPRARTGAASSRRPGTVDVVELALDVAGDAFVPPEPVGLEPLVHGAQPWTWTTGSSVPPIGARRRSGRASRPASPGAPAESRR